MPKYFNGLRTEGGIFGNEADSWNNEHKDEEDRLKGGAYRPQKKDEFIPVEDLRSRELNPEEKLIAKEEGETDNYEKKTELNEESGNEASEWEQHKDYLNSAFEGVDNMKVSEENEDAELVKLSKQNQKLDESPKKGQISPEGVAGFYADKLYRPHESHGDRGRKPELPKSLKARERFNKIERESLEKAKGIE